MRRICSRPSARPPLVNTSSEGSYLYINDQEGSFDDVTSSAAPALLTTDHERSAVAADIEDEEVASVPREKLRARALGIAAAIYLEEFAPRNRWTDLIEVNINNLAAVPSIVFGLLASSRQCMPR